LLRKLDVMGKLKKRHSGMKQTREPPRLVKLDQLEAFNMKCGDQRPLQKNGVKPKNLTIRKTKKN